MSDDSQHRLKAMKIKGILCQSLTLYRQNFRTLIGSVGPSVIIGCAAYLLIFGDWFSFAPVVAEASKILGVFLFGTIVLFVSAIGSAAGAIVISERFLNREVTIRQSFLRVVDAIFPLLGALTLSSTAISAGFIMLYIPGVVAYGWFCLAPAVIMVEGEGGVGALKRSCVIVKGYWNKAFAVVVFLAIGQLILAVLVYSLALQFRTSVSANLCFRFLLICLPLLIEPFKVCTTTVLYYDLRIRKENYTFQTMEDEITSTVS